MPLETSVSEDVAESCVPGEEMAECLPENSSSDEEEEKEWRYQQFRYTVFVHRYDYEIGRRNFLHSQSIFILSAIGLVMTLCLTLCTWPEARSLPYVAVATFMFFVEAIPILFSACFAIKILLQTYGREYAAYPSNLSEVPREHSHEYLEETNANLSLIIQKWIDANDISSREMRYGIRFFIIGGVSLICWIIVMGFASCISGLATALL